MSFHAKRAIPSARYRRDTSYSNLPAVPLSPLRVLPPGPVAPSRVHGYSLVEGARARGPAYRSAVGGFPVPTGFRVGERIISTRANNCSPRTSSVRRRVLRKLSALTRGDEGGELRSSLEIAAATIPGTGFAIQQAAVISGMEARAADAWRTGG